MVDIQAGQSRGAVTAASLVDEESLALRLIVSGTGLHENFVGHHATDLTHPSRYLLPGELVLTNGLWFTERAATEWMTEVKSAGSLAVAFGLTDNVPEVPERIIAAC